MRITLASVATAFMSTVYAQCPSVWTDVAADLKSSLVGSDGECTDDARAAIRLAIHDCFPSACDGSIILADECSSRAENTKMVGICSTLRDKATQFNVGTADLIQFAAAIGIVSCPGGPAISFKVGRTDSSDANPTGQIPGPNTNADALISLFAAKGFSATELVALVGAHSTAKNLAGDALDSTVGDWDTTFYSETADGSAPASLASDQFLSNSSATKDTWDSFAGSASGWAAAFVPAMEKMSILGNDESSLVDSSSVIASA